MIEELHVNGRSEILPTYRLVTLAVCATSEKVDAAGIEPPAVQGAAFVAALNSALELRHLAPRLADPQERREVERVLSEDIRLLEASRQG